MSSKREVYNEMMKAYAKASQASAEWNELNQLIIERERTYCENVGINPVIMGDRITDVKDKARQLKDLFSKYSFWKGEVERHSALLSGIAAYEEMQRQDRR